MKMRVLKAIFLAVISQTFFNAITEHEFELELEIMKLNKSSGYDGINASITKITANSKLSGNF